MKRLQGIMSLGDIYPIIEDESLEVHQMFKMCVQCPDVYIFMKEEGDALLIFLPMDRYKYNTHVYSLQSARGKKLKDFLIEAGLCMFRETSCTTIIHFIDNNDVHLQLFLGAVGSTRVGTIKNSCSGGDSIMYCCYKEDWI